MDHDQQVLQLRDFSQQQADDAATFATKSFLETLIDLINYSLNKQDDGTDSYKEELKNIKDSIKAFSTVLPTVYKTICQNEAETRLWELCRTLITLVESQLVTHSNTGVQINAIKCLQVLVLLLSKSTAKDASLNLIRADHRLLNVEELEKEGRELFEKIIEKLKADNESVLTATISCLVVIGKRRTQFLKEIIKVFSSWKKDEHDSPVMLRNVNKALKLAFITMIRTESLASFRPELMAAFGSIGGNVAMFQSRQSREQESRRLKRQQQQQQHDSERHEREKRARTEYVPIIPSASAPNILVNYDITQIPLPAIVNLCMTVLQTVPLEVMSERVSILPPQGVTLAAARPGFVRSTTPPYPPPPEQPKYNTNPKYKTEEELAALVAKKEQNVKKDPEDSDEDMDYTAPPPPPTLVNHYKDDIVKAEEKPKVQVLASVEERASQAFKMKPYELVKQQTELSDFEKKELLKMSIQRIFDAENMFQSNGNMLAIGNSTTISPANPTSSVWLLRMVKLITHGISQPPTTTPEETEAPEEQQDNKFDISTTDTENELKDLLLEFIVGKLSLRTDLALEWLHEEYLYDKRHSRSSTSTNYFYWFHKFLKKGIPTLDAKDRVLTKLLLEAPELNEETIELVKENLYNVPQRFVPCVSTLRSLVTNRPAIRSLALQVLLDICINENDNMRRTGLVAVKKWDQVDIHNKVEEFSVQALNMLATPKDIEMDGNEEQQEWSSKDVLRHAELYFVSCNKRPSLLKELFPVYIKSSEQVQGYIQVHMVNMIKSIGMKSLDLNKLLTEFPPGGESLVIKIISILCESKPPTREIISIVQTISELAKERSIDVESLVPILEGHSLSYQQTPTATTTTTAK